MNVFRSTLYEALDNKEVRIFRNSTMNNVCYRYFVTSEKQLKQFWEERQFGTDESPNKAYHVYVDEDVDRTSEEYRTLFRISRELDNGY